MFDFYIHIGSKIGKFINPIASTFLPKKKLFSVGNMSNAMDKIQMKKWFLVIFFASAPLCAEHFPKEIIVIGDSLSDSGNSRPAPNLDPPFYRTSPVTSGTTWAVFLASHFGADTLNPSSQGGTNYAYVGALTEGSFFFFENPSLKKQSNTVPLSKKSDPVFVFGGANDIFFDPSTITNPGADAARNILDILKTFHSRDFETLIAFTLPDLGLIPSAGSLASDYTTESMNFNTTLTNGLQELHFPVFEVDLTTLFNEII